MAYHTLKGSEKTALPGARAVEKTDPAERLEVSVIIRRAPNSGFEVRMAKLVSAGKAGGHMNREEFASQFGAGSADLAAIRTFAESHNLAVVEEDAGRRTVVLSGTAGQFNTAFNVELQNFEHDDGTYRGRTGGIQVPDELNGVVEAVLGLDNRPVALPHFRRKRSDGPGLARNANSVSFDPTQLAQIYNFPAGTGKGTCIALIELGGGYKTSDLKTYFAGLKVSPAPKVKSISVDHAKNHPTGTADGPDGEVMLDIEVAGSVAPGATIAVYFAPNTDAGFLDAITTAMHDKKNNPSVISISWGGPESSWTQQSLTSFDQAFQDAAMLGITVCVASGDNGSSDGLTDGQNHVDFPASSPHALACGGTSLKASGSQITSETVWNDGANGGAGGGGVSTVFPVPSWQQGLQATQGSTSAALTNRGVPDVSGDADPATGYNIRVDGNDTVFGGTSAVAPLWAGLLARINATRGSSVGFINPSLYQNPSALHDVTDGNNGSFSAAKGWDACTGLGSPDGAKLAALASLAQGSGTASS